MKNYLFIILCATLGFHGFTQEQPIGKKLFELSHKAEHFTTDQLGNIFLWNENFIWMYSNKGDSLSAFNSRNMAVLAMLMPLTLMKS